MKKFANQTKNGKAFEYVCALVLYKKYSEISSVSLVPSAQMQTAKRAYLGLTAEEKSNYIKGAEAAVKIIDRLEPRLSSSLSSMLITLQPDAAGMSGDVRDVVCIRGRDWEIGLSCKHNHEAVKHSRLSDQIDFAHEWFGKKCSSKYFEDVRAVFTPLRIIRDDSKANGNPAKWDIFEDKEKECYVPVLSAFLEELRRLDTAYPGEIPELLIRYLLGSNDFYKVIMDDKRQFTKIESVNINGTLNKKDGRHTALVDVPLLKMPTKFYELGFLDGHKNTIVVVCDEGWNVSMRIHNASSKIEPSLKFDVQLIAMPSAMLTQIEPWAKYCRSLDDYATDHTYGKLVAESEDE